MADASSVLATKDSVAGRAVVIGGSTLLAAVSTDFDCVVVVFDKHLREGGRVRMSYPNYNYFMISLCYIVWDSTYQA